MQLSKLPDPNPAPAPDGGVEASSDYTMVLDNAERGDGIGDVEMDDNYLAFTDYQGPFAALPGQDRGDSHIDPFALEEEQFGGGNTPGAPRYSLRRNISLTPKAQNCSEAHNAAQHRQNTIPGSPTPQAAVDNDLDDFKDLSPSIVSRLAHNYSSPVSESAEASAAAIDGEHIHPRSLYNAFMKASDFQGVILPGPAPTTTSPLTPKQNNLELAGPTETAPTTEMKTSMETTTTGTETETATLTPSHRGRRSAATNQKLLAFFCKVEKLFEDGSVDLERPPDMLKKIWKSNDKISRRESPWNTYQGYFSIYGDDELDRCKLESGTAADCFPSFIEEYGPHAEMIMQAALQLKRVSTEKETMQQRTRSFEKHCQKVEKLNQEGVAQRFQSLTIIIGECVNEDASLATITATPGLENLFSTRLKLDKNSIIALAKCDAYDHVAQELTENFDADKLIKDIEDALAASKMALTSIPAPEPKQGSSGVSRDPKVEEAMSCIDGDPIDACKTLLLIQFKNAGDAVNRSYKNKYVPWTTMSKQLHNISHVIRGWPAACPFPFETTKSDKSGDSSQGIKDLGHKNGRFLTALQQGEIRFEKVSRSGITDNIIPVIATADPTPDDPFHIKARKLFYSGKVEVIPRALIPPSAAQTRVKRKKTVLKDRKDVDILSVGSTDSPPPQERKRVMRKLVDVLTTSDDDDNNGSNNNNGGGNNDGGNNDDEDKPLTDIKKRRKLSTTRIVVDIPSDDDYVQDGDGDESETRPLRSPVKTRHGKAKQRSKRKEKVVRTHSAKLLGHTTSWKPTSCAAPPTDVETPDVGVHIPASVAPAAGFSPTTVASTAPAASTTSAAPVVSAVSTTSTTIPTIVAVPVPVRTTTLPASTAPSAPAMRPRPRPRPLGTSRPTAAPLAPITTYAPPAPPAPPAAAPPTPSAVTGAGMIPVAATHAPATQVPTTQAPTMRAPTTQVLTMRAGMATRAPVMATGAGAIQTMATQATVSESGVVPSRKITPVPSRPTIPPSNNCPSTFDSNPGLNNGAKALDSLGPPPEADHPNQLTLRKASVAHPSGVRPSVQAPGKRPRSQVNHCPEPTHLTSPHTVEHEEAMYVTLPEPMHYLPLNGPSIYHGYTPHHIQPPYVQYSAPYVLPYNRSHAYPNVGHSPHVEHSPQFPGGHHGHPYPSPNHLPHIGGDHYAHHPHGIRPPPSKQRYAVPHAAGPSHIRECDMVSHDPTVNETVDNDLQWAEEEMEEMRDDPDADMEG
ncbi:hypothetical protein H2248_010065 [Termitomyces sp. 'cryptogamus']|nr:hypothetical protein H2248_010065 [Termitomyces sp. 'cryptogamus']